MTQVSELNRISTNLQRINFWLDSGFECDINYPTVPSYSWDSKDIDLSSMDILNSLPKVDLPVLAFPETTPITTHNANFKASTAYAELKAENNKVLAISQQISCLLNISDYIFAVYPYLMMNAHIQSLIEPSIQQSTPESDILLSFLEVSREELDNAYSIMEKFSSRIEKLAYLVETSRAYLTSIDIASLTARECHGIGKLAMSIKTCEDMIAEYDRSVKTNEHNVSLVGRMAMVGNAVSKLRSAVAQKQPVAA